MQNGTPAAQKEKKNPDDIYHQEITYLLKTL